MGVVVGRPGRAFVCVCVSVFVLLCFMYCIFCMSVLSPPLKMVRLKGFILLIINTSSSVLICEHGQVFAEAEHQRDKTPVMMS